MPHHVANYLDADQVLGVAGRLAGSCVLVVHIAMVEGLKGVHQRDPLEGSSSRIWKRLVEPAASSELCCTVAAGLDSG